jgi:hypothetical protein
MDGTIPSVNAMIFSALARSKPPEFAFITITNPKDIKDSKKLSKIRRHARESTIRAKHERRRQARNLVFDFPEPRAYAQTECETALVQPTNMTQSYVTSGMDEDHYLLLSSRCLRPIGHGRGVSPLAPFPTATNSRMKHILDYGLKFMPTYVHEQVNLLITVLLINSTAYRPLVEMWMTTSMSDISAFQITVANAALYYAAGAGDRLQETPESLMHYNMSVQSVNRRLQDPVDGVSEGLIGAVIGFACHDVGSTAKIFVDEC